MMSPFYAKKISSFLKTDHHEEILGKKEIIDIIPNLNNVYGEPFADYSSIPTYLVTKLAKKMLKSFYQVTGVMKFSEVMLDIFMQK